MRITSIILALSSFGFQLHAEISIAVENMSNCTVIEFKSIKQAEINKGLSFSECIIDECLDRVKAIKKEIDVEVFKYLGNEIDPKQNASSIYIFATRRRSIKHYWCLLSYG